MTKSYVLSSLDNRGSSRNSNASSVSMNTRSGVMGGTSKVIIWKRKPPAGRRIRMAIIHWNITIVHRSRRFRHKQNLLKNEEIGDLYGHCTDHTGPKDMRAMIAIQPATIPVTSLPMLEWSPKRYLLSPIRNISRETCRTSEHRAMIVNTRHLTSPA